MRLSGFEKSTGFPVDAVGVAKKKEETSWKGVGANVSNALEVTTEPDYSC